MATMLVLASLLALSLPAGAAAAAAPAAGGATKSQSLPPKLAALLARAEADPESVARDLKSSPLAQLAAPLQPSARRVAVNATLPLVVAHGMGDSCFNPGMKSVTKEAGSHLGVYSTCIPTGDGEIEDTLAGFLLNMDKSVDKFAEGVRKDPKLAGGFSAFGLSQGNNLIRGYIQKYNDPPVHTFMSICGINAGVGAFPSCGPSGALLGPICEVVAEVLGPAANLGLVQDVLFQANYYRDPVMLNSSEYQKNNQLARWNGEAEPGSFNESFKENFLKTKKYVWVKGTEDTVVWPREGEWWGQADPADPWKKVLPMNRSSWFLDDAFGLRTGLAQGKMHFESFKGEHIRFTDPELYGWLTKYFTA